MFKLERLLLSTVLLLTGLSLASCGPPPPVRGPAVVLPVGVPHMAPVTFQGRPVFRPGLKMGAFVWHDAGGFHLRFTTAGGPRHFHGRVCAKGRPVGALRMVRPELNDKIRVGARGHCIVFDFKTAGGVDGFDFRAPGARALVFNIKRGPGHLRLGHIWVGGTNANPPSNPFVVARPAR